MPTAWMVLTGLIAALNLRLIVPGVLAFLGVWNPPVRPVRL
jgi:hypothetical protein